MIYTLLIISSDKQTKMASVMKSMYKDDELIDFINRSSNNQYHGRYPSECTIDESQKIIFMNMKYPFRECSSEEEHDECEEIHCTGEELQCIPFKRRFFEHTFKGYSVVIIASIDSDIENNFDAEIHWLKEYGCIFFNVDDKEYEDKLNTFITNYSK